MKRLEDLTLNELWHLFPIELVPHNEIWKEYYNEEYANLMKAFPNATINHIGSTAIPNILAKPIVDILMEVDDFLPLESLKEPITSLGYICMNQNENRIDFNKGYTLNGYEDKVFHLHLRYIGDNDEIYFRDYLLKHPDIAKEYEILKLNLAKKYKYDRDAYTAAKTEFIVKYTALARKEANSIK